MNRAPHRGAAAAPFPALAGATRCVSRRACGRDACTSITHAARRCFAVRRARRCDRRGRRREARDPGRLDGHDGREREDADALAGRAHAVGDATGAAVRQESRHPCRGRGRRVDRGFHRDRHRRRRGDAAVQHRRRGRARRAERAAILECAERGARARGRRIDGSADPACRSVWRAAQATRGSVRRAGGARRRGAADGATATDRGRRRRRAHGRGTDRDPPLRRSRRRRSRRRRRRFRS